MMYKVVHGLVAVPTTHLTAADSRTRANHSYKFRTISCNSTPYKYSFFPEPFYLGTSFQQKPPKLRPSMHSSIVFRSSAFYLHQRDIPSGSLPITFQIQIQAQKIKKFVMHGSISGRRVHLIYGAIRFWPDFKNCYSVHL